MSKYIYIYRIGLFSVSMWTSGWRHYIFSI